ncbi:MAG: hypothetical protein V4513_02995 [Pseudomonadota bacterium]
MRPLTGTSKLRRTAAILCGSIASLSLSACAVDQGRMAATLGSPPYLALNTGAEPSSLVRQSGYFSQQNGCLVFTPADSERAYTPVFPAGATALATDGIEWLGLYVSDSPVALNKIYRVSGASNAPVALAAPVPANCPQETFVVRTLGTAIADGNVYRHCAGVMICRSFGMK